MSNVIEFPQRLKLDGGGELRMDMTARRRSMMAWEKAKEYAKWQAELRYPDHDRREREESRIAHAEYRKLMFP
jgi:hypothetical protein